MKIVNDFPPNIDKIDSVLHVKDRKNVLYAYGDTIFNPGGGSLSDDLIAHEGVHRRQQEEFGSPDGWWDRYLADVDFRLSQEVEAYKTQLAYAGENYNRERRRQLRKFVVGSLASKMYGNIVTRKEADALL